LLSFIGFDGKRRKENVEKKVGKRRKVQCRKYTMDEYYIDYPHFLPEGISVVV
jgi:hypothetical protein